MNAAANSPVPVAASDEPIDAVRSGALARKLGKYSPLNSSDRSALDELEHRSEWVAAGMSLLAEGDDRDTVLPLLGGLAYRYKDFRDGRRQIFTLLIPGDICGCAGRIAGPLDYGVRTLTRVKLTRIGGAQFRALLDDHPTIAIALQDAARVEEAVLRAWMVNLGQRRAHERVAHLLCELALRLEGCGLRLSGGRFELPFTQTELGSVLGLTGVHINRVLQQLRAEKLIEFRDGFLKIHEIGKLQTVADFDPTYLLH